MDPGTLAFGLSSATLLLMVPTVFLPLVRLFRRIGRREWSVSFEGHTIQVIATESQKELRVDGRAVATKTTLSASGASLAWSYQGETGPPVELVATISYAGTVPHARILANGRWIGGDQPALPASTQDPDDPRWAAAKVLLADLRGATDAGVRGAGVRVEGSLRDLLRRHARLASARDAHATLGGEPAEIDAARARVDAQIAELLDALRQLHLVAVAGEPALSLDPIEETLRRIAAESEVAGLKAARARRGQTA